MRTHKKRPALSGAGDQDKVRRGKRILDGYAYYSGLALQMLVAIGGGAWLGYWLDGKYGTFPRWTLVLSLAGVAFSLLQIFKIVTADKTKNSRRY